MKKSGFTLIELLAVIIILTIIVLISVPTIVNVVETARKNSFKTSINGVIKSVENKYMSSLIKGEEIIMEIVIDENYDNSIPIRGKMPEFGRILINIEGESALALSDGTYCAQKSFSNKEISINKLSELEDGCEIPHFVGNVNWVLEENGEFFTAILPVVSGIDVEYSLDTLIWQSSNEFVNLNIDTEYTFYVRIAEMLQDETITSTSPRVFTVTYESTIGGSVEPTFRKILPGSDAPGVIATPTGSYSFSDFVIISGEDNIDSFNDQTGEVTNVQGPVTIRANFSAPIDTTFNYTGAPQQITLNPGTYSFETWGAGMERKRGGEGSGGYSYGEITITESTTVYVYVGGKGVPTSGYGGAGWNGGGRGSAGTYGVNYEYAAGGGGATDIRLVGGSWDDINSLRSRIIVAGGSGGRTIGGGLQAVSSISENSPSRFATGGGQTSGGSRNHAAPGTAGAGTFGKGGDGENYIYDHGSLGGGGGYYGGSGMVSVDWNLSGERMRQNNPNATGGSSFISGHPGANAVNIIGTHTGQPNHFSGFVFTNTLMQQGGRLGHGMARIRTIN